MKLFVHNLTSAPASWTRDVCQWKGIFCNKAKEITKIDFKDTSLTGVLDWNHFPAHVTSFRCQRWPNTPGKLRGEIHTHLLSPCLEHLLLCANQFTGPFDLTTLPHDMIDLYINHNLFNGPADLTSLPLQLSRLLATKNRFEGTIDLTRLPEHLTKLEIGLNLLSGSLDLTRLPKKLSRLELCKNTFEGAVELTSLSYPRINIDLGYNALTGFVDLRGVHKKTRIDLRGNKFEGYHGMIHNGIELDQCVVHQPVP